jgi:hypothetical protein
MYVAIRVTKDVISILPVLVAMVRRRSTIETTGANLILWMMENKHSNSSTVTVLNMTLGATMPEMSWWRKQRVGLWIKLIWGAGFNPLPKIFFQDDSLEKVYPYA